MVVDATLHSDSPLTVDSEVKLFFVIKPIAACSPRGEAYYMPSILS